MQRLSRQGADEEVALPVREQRARIKHGTRGRNGGIPIVDRLLHASLVRADADFTAVIVASVADDRPTVVFARLGNVDFIAAAGAMLDGPEPPARRVERSRLHIAVPNRPYLRPPTRELGVAGIGRPVRQQPHELADVVAWVLSLVALRETFPCRDKERPVRHEHETRTKVVA